MNRNENAGPRGWSTGAKQNTFDNNSIASIEDALYHITPDCPRDEWVEILMAIKSELGDGGMDLADKWSSGGASYKESDFGNTWRSIKPTGGITIATLFHLANQGGYCRRNNDQPYQPPPLPAIQPPDEAQRRLESQQKALQLWDSGTPAVHHPYTDRKGLEPAGLRVLGDQLLIPMCDADKTITCIQIIDDKAKKFLHGGIAKGCYLPIGKPTDILQVVIVEGWATGRSVHLATGFAVAVAFSCGNLGNVAAIMREKYPELEIILAPDNDKNRHAIEIAERAARQYNGRVVVPQFPEGSTGTDFDDLRQLAGLDEVKRQIMECSYAIQPHATPITDHGRGTLPAFEFIPACDIELRAIDWQVDGYFERHAITFIYGDTKAFKTFICLDIACAVATGQDWIPGCSVRQGRVLYVCGEGARGIRRRLEAWALHNKRPIPDNLLISRKSTDLGDPNAIMALVAALEEMEQKPVLVIVDTFARNFSGDENGNVDIGKFYASVEASLVKPYDCSVIVTHHVGKDLSKGARGGASLKQNADAMYAVRREDSGEQMFTVLKNEKMKDAEEPKDVMFEAIEYPIGVVDERGRESTSLALDFVTDAGRALIAEADKKDTAEEAEQHRKLLLKEIAADGTLIQKDYAAITRINVRTVSRYMDKLRNERYLTGDTGNLKVSPRGKMWCGADGTF